MPSEKHNFLIVELLFRISSASITIGIDDPSGLFDKHQSYSCREYWKLVKNDHDLSERSICRAPLSALYQDSNVGAGGRIKKTGFHDFRKLSGNLAGFVFSESTDIGDPFSTTVKDGSPGAAPHALQQLGRFPCIKRVFFEKNALALFFLNNQQKTNLTLEE